MRVVLLRYNIINLHSPQLALVKLGSSPTGGIEHVSAGIAAKSGSSLRRGFERWAHVEGRGRVAAFGYRADAMLTTISIRYDCKTV